MKGIARIDRIVLGFNVLAVVLLIAACFAPVIRNPNLSYFSFLGHSVPPLALTHLIFMGYWLFRGRKYVLLSLVPLLLAYWNLDPFFKLRFSEREMEGDLTVMSYNVRCFNRYEELPSKTVLRDIKAFVREENPDIICIQEPFYNSGDEFKNYPYRSLEYFHMIGKGLLAVFSKYPIIETGMLNFSQTESNGIYADIRYKNDTIRVYNVHLESLGITPGRGVLSKEPTDKLFHQINQAYRKQGEQAQVIKAHMQSSPYKNMLCGDFNNGPYSNVYQLIRGELQDTFLEAGKGYGRTYLFHGVPFRIDFVMADPAFEVKTHTNYDVPYSDHFPVMASFELLADEVTIR